MKFLFPFVFLALTIVSCGNPEQPKSAEEEQLVEVKNGIYTEYYPGRKAVKFKGPEDAQGKRHGVWYFYDENGREQSMTEYDHGVKNGASFVRFPNGNMRYFGNYTNDKPSGEWIIYNEDGTINSKKDYGKTE